MTEAELLQKWEAERPLYLGWGRHVVECVRTQLMSLLSERALEEIIKIEPVPRLKTASSFIDKALRRKKYKNPYDDVEDKVGVRFVVLLTRDIRLVQQAIENCGFEISKDRDYEDERANRPLEFTYQSVHFIVRPKQDITVDGMTFTAGMPCEVQVRTLLQHAHSELTHDRIYKGKSEAPPKVFRNVARSMALIETTDDFFDQVVRDLDEVDRPSRDLVDTLATLYRQHVGGPPERAKSNALIAEELLAILGDEIPAQIEGMLQEKPFIASRIRDKAPYHHLFRQPTIFLAYLGAYKTPSSTSRAWPFTDDELRPVFNDLGLSLDDY